MTEHKTSRVFPKEVSAKLINAVNLGIALLSENDSAQLVRGLQVGCPQESGQWL